MKKAFTLIELIFVIVILGILAAVAIPKFIKLKENAEIKSIVKITTDSADNALAGAINMLDVENKTVNDFELKDILHLIGKNWAYVEPNNWHWGKFKYPKDADPNKEVAIIALLKDDNGNRIRTLRYRVNCNEIDNLSTKNKCIEDIKDLDKLDGVEDNKVQIDIPF